MNNLELMRKRFEYQGGIAQDERMINDKYRTFLRALKYSYQACDVELIQPFSSCLTNEDLKYQKYRALINSDKTKQDYDDKILSIDYNSGFGPGDVFYWIGTQTYWIIYLQALTEDSYFRGEIRRCKYQIKFRDEEGNFLSTWAAIRGPVETQIDSIQKNQIRVDRPNLSLNILLPKNEKTLKAFDRYREFIFAGRCWRVEAPDSISMENIIEINAEEYFIDRETDNDVKNGLVVEPIDPSPNTEIKGETFIKPKMMKRYKSPEPGGKWIIIEKKIPVTMNCADNSNIDIIWNSMVSGQFTLQWNKGDKVTTKTIVVESLF